MHNPEVVWSLCQRHSDNMDTSNQMIELERPPIIETSVLVRLILPGEAPGAVEESLEEMRQLAWTAGANVARTVTQQRQKPCPATLVGAGKAAQMAAICEEVSADLVLFDSDLTPTQGVKLEQALGVKVVDRTQLILDIFAQHAHTNEGKHQVELAQLQYLLPRLAGRGAVMRQQGGIGVRGPGEQKLEVDRRLIRRRIQRLERELEAIRRKRRVRRGRRADGAPCTVALVGYTNAGKSSLLNALCDADVLVEDKLFATLDPRARRRRLPSGREVVLADTVGFIQRLPHQLVAAFRATLEEITEAQVILLVADAAHSAVEEHIEAVYGVLREIEATETPIIRVLNKIDIALSGRLTALAGSQHGRCVAVSARTGAGLDGLLSALDEELAAGLRRVTLRIPQSRAGLLTHVRDGGRVLAQRYEDNAILVDAELDAATAGRMAEYFT